MRDLAFVPIARTATLPVLTSAHSPGPRGTHPATALSAPTNGRSPAGQLGCTRRSSCAMAVPIAAAWHSLGWGSRTDQQWWGTGRAYPAHAISAQQMTQRSVNFRLLDFAFASQSPMNGVGLGSSAPRAQFQLVIPLVARALGGPEMPIGLFPGFPARRGCAYRDRRGTDAGLASSPGPSNWQSPRQSRPERGLKQPSVPTRARAQAAVSPGPSEDPSEGPS